VSGGKNSLRSQTQGNQGGRPSGTGRYNEKGDKRGGGALARKPSVKTTGFGRGWAIPKRAPEIGKVGGGVCIRRINISAKENGQRERTGKTGGWERGDLGH